MKKIYLLFLIILTVEKVFSQEDYEDPREFCIYNLTSNGNLEINSQICIKDILGKLKTRLKGFEIAQKSAKIAGQDYDLREYTSSSLKLMFLKRKEEKDFAYKLFIIKIKDNSFATFRNIRVGQSTKIIEDKYGKDVLNFGIYKGEIGSVAFKYSKDNTIVEQIIIGLAII